MKNYLGLLLVWLTFSGFVAGQESQPAGSHQDLTWFVDQDDKLQTVQSAKHWQLRRQSILAGMQDAMGNLPSRETLPDPAIKSVESKQSNGFERRTITFVSEPGDRVSADLYIPAGASAEKPRAAMLALHPTGAAGKRIVAGEDHDSTASMRSSWQSEDMLLSLRITRRSVT